jgi:hypothetical protein
VTVVAGIPHHLPSRGIGLARYVSPVPPLPSPLEGLFALPPRRAILGLHGERARRILFASCIIQHRGHLDGPVNVRRPGEAGAARRCAIRVRVLGVRWPEGFAPRVFGRSLRQDRSIPSSPAPWAAISSKSFSSTMVISVPWILMCPAFFSVASCRFTLPRVRSRYLPSSSCEMIS